MSGVPDFTFPFWASSARLAPPANQPRRPSIQREKNIMTFHLRLAILCAMALPMAAQTFRGGLNGSVEDSSGAVLGDAKISAVNTATGFSRAVLTGSTGEFSIPDLPPGVYSVSAAKPGFQDQKNDVEVVVSRVSSINFRLPVASQSSTVMVSAEVVSIDTTSTTLTGVVNTRTVSDLPMDGRDFRQMLKLAPGVSPAVASINCRRTRGNNYQIDGADNNHGFQNSAAGNHGGAASTSGTLLPFSAHIQLSPPPHRPA